MPKGLLGQPRVRLAQLPTPLYYARRLTERLGGPRIYLKRDDLTGLATGGNKTRKLEYLVADALRQQATHLITEGGVQSNHCRQTAAAAKVGGMECVLVLNCAVGDPPLQGNLLLNKLLGATWRIVEKGEDRPPMMEQVATEIREQGGIPYVIPTGGSNAVGAIGYVGMILELNQQLHERDIAPSQLYSGVCSGGTHAGLALGAAMFGSSYGVTGVLASDTAAEGEETASRIAKSCQQRLGTTDFSTDRVHCDDSQVGDGYGIPTTASLEAMRLLMDTEGILLDPVYSSKGFAGLLSDVGKRKYSSADSLVFVHTGGQASLFGKVDSLGPLLDR